MSPTQLLFKVDDIDRKDADAQLLKLQRTIDFDTKEFTVEIIVHKFRSGDLYIPEYQRKFVWNQSKQAKFVESVLLGLPIPFMFGAEVEETGEIEIVDGAQRVQTLSSFMQNDLRLRGLEKLTFLNDFRYEDLSVPQQRRFKNRTLRMVVLSGRTDLTSRFDIFERINTGSLSLAPAELRKGAFPGPFYEFIASCAESELFRDLCPITPTLAKRGEREELILRFFAYSDEYRKFRHDVAKFLNDYLRRRNRRFDRKLFAERFERMLAFVDEHFRFGFRKSKNARSTPRVRFEAISVGVHLALEKQPGLKPASMDWLQSEEFLEHTTTHASNSAKRLRGRIEFVRDALLGSK